jgi:microcystin-dependent protein
MTIGLMIDWPGRNVPDGYLPADGRAVSRTIYSQLFEAYGTQHGAGDGETTFNLPDSRGRVTIGLDPGNATGRVTPGVSGVNPAALGTGGGNQSLMVHSHSVYDPTHAHTVTVHDHAHYDPTHAHTGGNHEHILPNHQHGLWDPSHGHGVGDPGHGHVGDANYQNRSSNSNAPNNYGTLDWSWPVSGSGIGIWTGGSGSGCVADWGGGGWTEDGTGQVGSYGAGVGTWSDWRGIGVYGAYTGISIYNAGDGGSQNVQPSLVVQKLVYTGVYGVR